MGSAMAKASARRLPVKTASCSHGGRRSGTNEDRPLEAGLPGPDGGGYLIAVADGMGGLECGEVASAAAIEALGEACSKWPENSLRELRPRLQEAYDAANQAVLEALSSEGEVRDGGCTLVCAAIIGRRLMVANVGDSRAYLIRDGAIRQLSEDHTALEDLKRRGMDVPDTPAAVMMGHALTKAIGRKDNYEPDLVPHAGPALELQDGDVVLLCTDGVYNFLETEDFVERLRGTPNLDCFCDQVVKLALARGSDDNCTIAAAEYGQAERGRRLKLLPSASTILASPVPGAKAVEPRVRALDYLAFGLCVALGALLAAIFIVARLQASGTEPPQPDAIVDSGALSEASGKDGDGAEGLASPGRAVNVDGDAGEGARAAGSDDERSVTGIKPYEPEFIVAREEEKRRKAEEAKRQAELQRPQQHAAEAKEPKRWWSGGRDSGRAGRGNQGQQQQTQRNTTTGNPDQKQKESASNEGRPPKSNGPTGGPSEGAGDASAPTPDKKAGTL